MLFLKIKLKKIENDTKQSLLKQTTKKMADYFSSIEKGQTDKQEKIQQTEKTYRYSSFYVRAYDYQ